MENVARLVRLIIIAMPVIVADERYFTFRAVHGRDVGSNKPSLAVLTASSRLECLLDCVAVSGCGGFNYHLLTSGSSRCDLKESMSFGSRIQAENATVYYERTGQNPSLESRDCSDLRDAGVSVSGVYDINMQPEGVDPEFTKVYCDMDTVAGNGWTILFRRQDGSVDFNRTWLDYKNGFGNISGEFWIGLDLMHNLTNNGKSYKVRIDMRLFTGQYGYAEYSTFYVSSEADDYRLSIAGYSGNTSDSFSYHDGMAFSTPDKDNDVYHSNCALMYNSGFWYKNCSQARLTGLYGEDYEDTQGIMWLGWLNFTEHPQYIDMKIKP